MPKPLFSHVLNLRNPVTTTTTGPPSGAAGGDLAGTYPNPTLTPAAKSKWQVAGSTLAPIDATKTVACALADAFQWGGSTVKGRLVDQTAGDIQWRVNASASAVQDDATKSSWILRLGPTLDSLLVQRAPAGSTTYAVPLSVDASGNLAAAAGISTGGATSAYSLPGLRLTGSTAGIRCQSAGTSVAADGYSNAIGLGWGPALMARVDGTALGTVNVTPPSDERLKVNVVDDVPGLAAVSALRPITFEYDQTKRAIGFPPGRQYGLIAQEALPHVPLAIEDDGSDAHWLGLDYRMLVPVLIRAVQELAARVAALEGKP